MKKKELAALGLSVALVTTTTTGCGIDTAVYENQIAELSAQVESLQDEVSEAQSESADATSKNAELESQVANLQEQLENVESELEYAENVIKSADDDTAEMTINVTKYSHEGTAIHTKAEENEENKIAELDLNDEVYVVSVFSANDGNNWSAVGVLKTTDENGDVTYQIITSVEKGEERAKNKNVDFFFRKMKSITVASTEKGGETQVINMQDLEENQEVVMIYCRSSLLSNEKVKEESKTSTQVQKEKKDTQQQQTQPSTGGNSTSAPDWWYGEGACNCQGCTYASGTVWN